MDNELVMNIIRLVIMILCGVITTFIVPYIKSKIGTEKLTQIMSWVDIFVRAAEQIVEGSGKGEEKLTLVTTWVKEKAATLGVTLTDDDIRVLIEDAVNVLNTSTVTETKTETESEVK